jgi:hypothetical protein
MRQDFKWYIRVALERAQNFSPEGSWTWGCMKFMSDFKNYAINFFKFIWDIRSLVYLSDFQCTSRQPIRWRISTEIDWNFDIYIYIYFFFSMWGAAARQSPLGRALAVVTTTLLVHLTCSARVICLSVDDVRIVYLRMKLIVKRFYKI